MLKFHNVVSLAAVGVVYGLRYQLKVASNRRGPSG